MYLQLIKNIRNDFASLAFIRVDHGYKFILTRSKRGPTGQSTNHYQNIINSVVYKLLLDCVVHGQFFFDISTEALAATSEYGEIASKNIIYEINARYYRKLEAGLSNARGTGVPLLQLHTSAGNMARRAGQSEYSKAHFPWIPIPGIFNPIWERIDSFDIGGGGAVGK